MSLPAEDVQHFQNRKLKKNSFRQPQLIFQDHSNLLLSILFDHSHKLLAATLLKSKLLLLSPLPSPWKTTKQNLDILAPLSLLKELQTILAAFPKLFEILPLIQKQKTNWINLDYLCRLSRQPLLHIINNGHFKKRIGYNLLECK
ncbi:hypothetical protein CEXT_113581 [Caerostris extrusa]|uniref:Maturase K n=1 Tax=Caerostris extrusa TaxID=172846 RepID=A0AAV4YBK5_CAEEX|nr:hypothetical protein CEXT_113581 [Caerostris extrusa]